MAYLIDWRRWHIVIERRKQRNLAIKPSIRNINRRLANEDSRFFFSFFVCAAILCIRFENSPLGTPSLATRDAFSSLSLSLPLHRHFMQMPFFPFDRRCFPPSLRPRRLCSARSVEKRERETPSIAHPSWTKSTRCQTVREGKEGKRQRNRIKFQASVTPAKGRPCMQIEHPEMHGSIVGTGRRNSSSSVCR